MQSIGFVLEISKNRDIIVEGTFVPKIGNRVRVGDKRVGKVAEVFGPVKAPYITVKPLKNVKIDEKMIGKEVYI